MIIPGGTDYPTDYAVTITRDHRYTIGTEARAMERHPVTSRWIIPYDDHPVVRSYRAIVAAYDAANRDHRSQYLEWIAMVLPGDDWGIISEVSPRIVAAVQERNRMDDEEALMRRLEAAETRMAAVESELSDDARAQGDAMARTGSGVLTVEVPQ